MKTVLVLAQGLSDYSQVLKDTVKEECVQTPLWSWSTGWTTFSAES